MLPREDQLAADEAAKHDEEREDDDEEEEDDDDVDEGQEGAELECTHAREEGAIPPPSPPFHPPFPP